MKLTLIILVAIGSLLGCGLKAQDRVKEGDRVRIHHHSVDNGEQEVTEGWLVRIYPGDSIVASTRINRERVSLPADLVDLIKVRRIKSRVGFGALLGSIGGGLIVLPFTSAECSGMRNTHCYGRGSALFGFAGGLLVGGVVGSFIQSPAWIDVTPKLYPVLDFQPRAGSSYGFGLSANFKLYN